MKSSCTLLIIALLAATVTGAVAQPAGTRKVVVWPWMDVSAGDYPQAPGRAPEAGGAHVLCRLKAGGGLAQCRAMTPAYSPPAFDALAIKVVAPLNVSAQAGEALPPGAPVVFQVDFSVGHSAAGYSYSVHIVGFVGAEAFQPPPGVVPPAAG